MYQCASYTTGLIKCRSNYQGQAFGERISKCSVDNVQRVAMEVKQMGEGKGKRLIVLNFVFKYNIHFYTKNL
jgi:hypothetical protein